MQGTSSDSIPPRQVVRMGAERKAIGRIYIEKIIGNQVAGISG
jgi:hypothetical protein